MGVGQVGDFSNQRLFGVAVGGPPTASPSNDRERAESNESGQQVRSVPLV
jgi:hypothetical protein